MKIRIPKLIFTVMRNFIHLEEKANSVSPSERARKNRNSDTILHIDKSGNQMKSKLCKLSWQELE